MKTKIITIAGIFSFSLMSYAEYDRRIDSGTVNLSTASSILGPSGKLSNVDIGSTDPANPVRINIIDDVSFVSSPGTFDQRYLSGYMTNSEGAFDHWEMRNTVISIADGKTLTFSGATRYAIAALYTGTNSAATASNLSIGPTGTTGRVIFQGNSAVGDGDTGGYGAAIQVNAHGVFTLTNADFIDNSAGGANANFAYGAAINISGETHISSSSFTNNTANNNGEAFFRAYGGAINVGAYTTAKTYISDSVFTGNSTYGDGGAIHASSLLLNISNADFISNMASTHANNENGGGGALYIDRNASILGGKFTSNTAASGGAVEYTGMGGSENYTLLIDGSEFKNNEAWGEAGGGAINSYGQVSVKNALFENNHARNQDLGSGGAIKISASTMSDSVVSLVENSTFRSNTASIDGGAIFIVQNDTDFDYPINATICDCQFFDNSARAGGAISIMGSGTVNFEITSGKHLSSSGNTAQQGGGFIAMHGGGLTQVLNLNIADNASYTIGVKGTSIDEIDSISGADTSVVNKTGGGKFVVNSENFYLGATNIVEGEFTVNAVWGGRYTFETIDWFQRMSVKSGASVSGLGRIGGVTTVENGGILSPGNGGVGEISFDDLTLEGGAILKIERGDSIKASTLRLGNTSTDKIFIELLDFAGDVGDYQIISYNEIPGLIESDLSAYFDLGPDFTGSVYSDGVSGIFIDGVLIPEPSETSAFLCIVAIAFAIYRKRKRK